MGYLSWCFVPRTYEAYARSSVVTGPYGTGQEYGGGLNWYLKRSRQARLTLEALHINRSPAQNFLYPYRAGYTGTAIQTQLSCRPWQSARRRGWQPEGASGNGV